MIDEVFCPVIGFENRFEVSNKGTLISINGRYLGRKVCQCRIDSFGYAATTLRGNRKKWCVRIHTLVAKHFVENEKPELFDTVNHMDGNKRNNHHTNLEWCTRGMNTEHAFRTGIVDFKGEKSAQAKIKDADVIEMRRKYATGNYTQNEIAAPFGMCRRHIGDILNRVCWKHI